MKNIHLLPTDKSSRLSIKDGILILHRLQWRKGTHHIYITSDEEIKEGDWFMSDFNSFPLHNIKELSEREGTLGWKQKDLKNNLKIILTTDQDLIKDGVQAIEDDFLEWFVKNPSCEWVEVEIESKFDRVDGHYHDVWEIIIPKEEPKQHVELINDNIEEFDKAIKLFKQETLEESAERISKTHSVYETGQDDFYQGFIAGAKWQQERMYSEEETIQLLIKFNQEIQEVEDVRIWFEKFKKK